jgi:hypothetical protein
MLRYDDDVRQFERITMDPEVMDGKPCMPAGPSNNCWLILPI